MRWPQPKLSQGCSSTTITKRCMAAKALCWAVRFAALEASRSTPAAASVTAAHASHTRLHHPSYANKKAIAENAAQLTLTLHKHILKFLVANNKVISTELGRRK